MNNFYGFLPTIIRHDKNVSDFACRLYSELASLSNKFGYSFATNDYLAEVFNKTPEHISRVVSSMQKAGYLSVVIEDGYKRKIYVKTSFEDLEGVDKKIKGGKQEDQGGLIKISRGVDKNIILEDNNQRMIIQNDNQNKVVEPYSTVTLIDEVDETSVEIHHVPDYFNTETKKEKKISGKRKETPAADLDLVYQVVTYLNEKTEQQFQPGGEKTKSLILARHHADKWNLDDFKTVIDHKKSEWFVKDNLRQYLRPSTLFAAGHAEEYLQAAKLWKKKPVATSPGVVPLFRQENFVNTDRSKFKF